MLEINTTFVILYIKHIANHSSMSPSTVALIFDYTFFLTIITTARMHAVMVTTNNTDIYKPMQGISKEYSYNWWF